MLSLDTETETEDALPEHNNPFLRVPDSPAQPAPSTPPQEAAASQGDLLEPAQLAQAVPGPGHLPRKRLQCSALIAHLDRGHAALQESALHTESGEAGGQTLHQLHKSCGRGLVERQSGGEV